MANSVVMTLWFALLIAVPVLIGVYVYRDSHCRGMNAALWTIVAVFAPALVGFIIYLLVRGSYPNIRCPQCGERVERNFSSCPHCGAKLKASCSKCGYPVEKSWKNCPQCGTELNSDYSDVFEPEVKKDKTLGKILAAIIIIPLVLVIGGAVMFATTSSNVETGWENTRYSVETFNKHMEVSTSKDEVDNWMKNCPKDDKAYVLKNQFSSGKSTRYEYIVYIPGLYAYGIDETVDMVSGSVLKNDKLILHINDAIEDEDAADDAVKKPEQFKSENATVIVVEYYGESEPKVEVEYSGEKMQTSITKAETPLADAATSENIKNA